MDWTIIWTKLFEVILLPLLSVGVSYLIAFINAKIKQVKKKTENETLKKYLDLLNTTIVNCVKSTQQAYVDSLKKQGKFDAEAQKEAFRITYENIKAQLSDEAEQYIYTAVGDLQTYIKNKIEAEILNLK